MWNDQIKKRLRDKRKKKGWCNNLEFFLKKSTFYDNDLLSNSKTQWWISFCAPYQDYGRVSLILGTHQVIDNFFYLINQYHSQV